MVFVESTFTALRDGMDSCLGESTVEGEGLATTEAMTIPEVGVDRYAQLMTIGGGRRQRRVAAAHRTGP